MLVNIMGNPRNASDEAHKPPYIGFPGHGIKIITSTLVGSVEDGEGESTITGDGTCGIPSRRVTSGPSALFALQLPFLS
jgi:hypothetical protein